MSTLKTKLKQSSTILLILFAAIEGCQLEWYFSIKSFDNASRPHFCITIRPNCTGEGVPMAYFDVEEVMMKDGTESRRVVWRIARRSNKDLREVTYGLAPPGWEQLVPAEPLQIGHTYEVGRYWFKLKNEDGKLDYEIAPIGEPN